MTTTFGSYDLFRLVASSTISVTRHVAILWEMTYVCGLRTLVVLGVVLMCRRENASKKMTVNWFI